MRGRPSLPFAAPCPGKPGKGSATFTFSSRIWRGCTALDVDFGSIFDKRKPQFIHGSSLSGAVTSSDRRGKFDAWGFSNPVFFRHFHEIHPGYPMYGLDSGECVGLPNIMEVSQAHGMVYLECTPAGDIHFLPVGEKQARSLVSFTGISMPKDGIPHINVVSQSPSAVWLAKSAAIPQATQGMVGTLVGSSNGTITAYSLGSIGGQKFERGEMTTRWILSPGVPIVSICADDCFNEGRLSAGRVWAIAVNALGEVFYLNKLPLPNIRPSLPRSNVAIESNEKEEWRAWITGSKISWRLVIATNRVERYPDPKQSETTDLLPKNVHYMRGLSYRDKDAPKLQEWLQQSPIEVREWFQNWDMKRTLLADFASDDGNGAGEIAIILREGDEQQRGDILRCQRSKLHASESADEWMSSRFLQAHHKSLVITACAMDQSILALTTPDEDRQLSAARAATRHQRAPPNVASFKEGTDIRSVPGRRARLFAVGTSTGGIFVYNARASTSAMSDIINDIQPVRIIATDSPGIASLALSSLYLVHGGTEGLLQAWDLLASTTEPLRTLSSRRLVNNRRRAILAAQQASVPPTWVTQDQDRIATGAIALDPDPTVLRGVATIDTWVKYWSYSSSSAAEDLTRSQKRKMKRGNGSKNPLLSGSGDADLGWSGSASNRRTNLKGYVSQELRNRTLDEAERRRESREDRRFAGRFGTELLGANASEADMIAYAKLLSQEEDEKRLRSTVEANVKLSRDASVDDIEAHMAALSEKDAANWKFASWKQRFEMLPEGGVALPREYIESDSQVATPTAEDPDLKRAVDLSLEEERRHSESQASVGLPDLPAQGSSKTANSTDLVNDPDLAEAIALSLSQDEQTSSSPSPDISTLRSAPEAEEDDLERAIRLSMADQEPSVSSTEISQPSHRDEDDFPILNSSPPTAQSQSQYRKGKGRKTAW